MLQAYQGSDTSTVEQAENDRSQVNAVVLSCDVVEHNQCSSELELVRALVLCDPMGCDAQIRPKVLVGPKVRCETDLPD